jgi:hypothetical protein
MKPKSHEICSKVELELKTKEGKTVWKHTELSKSWVKNFLGIIRAGMTGDSQSLLDTTGTSRSMSVIALAVDGTSGAANGVVVGTGDTPADKADYNLESSIAHGTGSGQLSRGGNSVDTLGGTDPETRLRIIRVFTNGSGDTVTVKELGLIGYATYYLLLLRHVLETPVAVPNTLSLTVRVIVTTDTSEGEPA